MAFRGNTFVYQNITIDIIITFIMKYKPILLLALTVALLSSCHRTRNEVIEKYPNGKAKLVYQVQGKDENKQRVGEKMYYEDGQLRWEKHFRDEQPTGIWRYYYGNGQQFAQGDFGTNHRYGAAWQFSTAKGKALREGTFDSVTVTAFTPEMFPTTLAYHHQDSIWAYEYYEDLSLRATGQIVGNRRDGHWIFYYPTGVTQAEAIYADGVENGMHCAYRENGTPYYRGAYINGQRAGAWEFYDQDGNLCGTKNFDK